MFGKALPLLLLFLNSINASSADLNPNLDYEFFPLRSSHEAAVVEWGNSAIISALDAAVASFGPQTSLGAYFEVETAPVLAQPINGRGNKSNIDAEKDSIVGVPYPGPLANKDEVDGNMVVMTNNGDMSGVAMARVAKESGAAALMIVNVDQDSPDYIYSHHPETDEEEAYAKEHIDIPVIMVSLASGNLITTATVEEGMKEEDIVNNGMPDRIRLYAAGDRPFFEDVIPQHPVLYLIHNLLTEEECKMLITASEGKMDKIDDTKSNLLENTVAAPDRKPKAHNIEKMMLWKGQTNGHLGKQIEERIEQVTGYPQDQFSDWEIWKYEKGSKVELHHDSHPIYPPVATITVFLSDVGVGNGGEIVYTNPKESFPVKILPLQGLAVVHHNTDQSGASDPTALNGELPLTGSIKYVAKKYVYAEQLPPSKRMILPTIATISGGKLPRVVITIHDTFLVKFGLEQGTIYFDKFCMMFPVLILLLIAQIATVILKDKFSQPKEIPSEKKKSKKGKKSSKKSD